MGEFFLPSMHAMLAGNRDVNPLDMKNGIFLNDCIYKQTTKEVQISPEKAVVADFVGVQEYIYYSKENIPRLLNQNDKGLYMFSSEA